MPGDPRREKLQSDTLMRFVMLDSHGGHSLPRRETVEHGLGAQMMREAVSLMGGYGITEDCPGFLGNKWMDAQLEATYEGPEAVQRRQLSVTMTNPVFLAQFRNWIREMRGIASERPGTGACTLATAMTMWLWSLERLQHTTDSDGGKLYQSARQGVTFPLADALCWLLAARCQILDVLELNAADGQDASVAEGLSGLVNFITDLCHVQTARAGGEAPGFAPSLFSATTATLLGMKKARAAASSRTNSMHWKDSFRGSPPALPMSSAATALIQEGRSLREMQRCRNSSSTFTASWPLA